MGKLNRSVGEKGVLNGGVNLDINLVALKGA